MMKNMMKALLRIGCFFLVFLLICLLASWVFLPKDNTEEAGMDQISANGILAEPENSLDLLIVGDSVSYCAFSPMLMFRDYGFTSYVYGTSGQRMYETARYMHQFLKNQNPRMLILEANAIFRASGIKNYVASKAEALFPLVQYHNRWKNLSLRDFFGPLEYTAVNDFKGYRYKTGVSAGILPDYMAVTAEVEPISRVNELCLQEILRFCEKREIPVMLVSAPSMDNWSYAKHNGIQAFADANGLEYFDMNLVTDEMGLDWNWDTIDKGDHLSHRGAIKVSEYFGAWIDDKLDLPDHREEPEFAAWHDSLARYLKEVHWKFD